ncbi:MAG: hypothetical protein Q8K26_03270, partial [Candidatus Gracilibacteria bacterium]|nr:hypothetical protein [Candidatus Gracilibacteria bacterium]
MGIFDKDIPISSSDSQTLRDVIGAPIVNDAILDGSSLPSAYVEEKIIPELVKISDQKKLEALKLRVKGNKDLLALIEDYTVSQFAIGTLPGTMSGAEQIREGTKSTFKSVDDFTTGLIGFEDEKSKENRMRNEVIVRRRSIMAKFDRYVNQGDGKQKGDDTSFWGFNDADELTKNVTNHKEVQGSVHDVMRDDMIKVLNEVAKISMDDSLEGINFFGNTLKFDSKLEKLTFFASYLSAVEEGCDEIIPGIISQGIDTTTGVVGDTTKGLVDKGLGIAGDTVIGTLKLAGTHWFVSGLLITAAVSTIRGKSWAGKLLRNKIARNIPKVGQYIPEAGVTTPVSTPASGTTSSTSPESVATTPEISKTHVELARQKAVLESMYKQYSSATAPVMTLEEFKTEALDPGTVTNLEYQSRLEKVTKLHNELIGTRDPAMKQDLRGDIEKVLSGVNDKSFLQKMKNKGIDAIENTKRKLSGKGRLHKWNFSS